MISTFNHKNLAIGEYYTIENINRFSLYYDKNGRYGCNHCGRWIIFNEPVGLFKHDCVNHKILALMIKENPENPNETYYCYEHKNWHYLYNDELRLRKWGLL